MERTNYEMAKAVRNSVLSSAAQGMLYSDFSSIKEKEGRLKRGTGFKQIDPNDLTLEQLEDLGFGRWSDESTLRLIPGWIFPFLSDTFVGASIMNEEARELKRNEIDNDMRFGCLAFGVFPKE